MDTIKLSHHFRPTCFRCGRIANDGRFHFAFDREEDNMRTELVLECAELNEPECRALTHERVRRRNIAWKKKWIRNKLSRPRVALPLP